MGDMCKKLSSTKELKQKIKHILIKTLRCTASQKTLMILSINKTKKIFFRIHNPTSKRLINGQLWDFRDRIQMALQSFIHLSYSTERPRGNYWSRFLFFLHFYSFMDLYIFFIYFFFNFSLRPLSLSAPPLSSFRVGPSNQATDCHEILMSRPILSDTRKRKKWNTGKKTDEKNK